MNKNDEELFIPKEKHSLKIITLIIILIIILGGVYYYYKEFYSNPQFIITNIIKKADQKLNNEISEIDEYNCFKINGLINFNLDFRKDYQELASIISNISLQINGEIDQNSNEKILNLNTKYKDNELLNVKTYQKEKNDYIYLEDIFDKYLLIEDNEISNNINIFTKTKDLKITKDSFIKALATASSDLKFQRKETEITISKQNYQVNENYIELKDNELNSFLIKILNLLLEDKDFLGAFGNITNNENQKIKEDIEEIINELKKEPFNGIYKLSFYTERNLKQNLISIREEIRQEKEQIIITIDVVKQNLIKASINYNDSYIDYTISTEDNKFNMEIELKSQNYSIKLNCKFNYDKIDHLTNIDISNSVKVNDLNEDEISQIENNLLNNTNIQKIVNEMQGILLKRNEV